MPGSARKAAIIVVSVLLPYTGLINFPALAVPGVAEDGVYQWTATWGDVEFESIDDVTVDTNGDFYIAGSYSGTKDFDFGVGTTYRTSNGSTDAFVAKYDIYGNLVWVKPVGGINTDRAWQVKLDASGNVYALGEFTDEVDFNPSGDPETRTAAGEVANNYLIKYTNDGEFEWVRAWGGLYNPCTYLALGLDSSGNAYAVTVISGETIDFNDAGGDDLQTAEVGETNYAITKYLNNGNYGATFMLVGDSCNGTPTISIDGSALYMAATIGGTIDFDPGVGEEERTAVDDDDLFLAKYSTAGVLSWVRLFTGTGTEYLYDLVASEGYAYITGSFASSVDFDPEGAGDVHSTASEGAMFITKYAANGSYGWTESFGSDSGSSNGYSIELDSNADLYTVGYFNGDVDFDPGVGTVIRSNLSGGFFLLKLNSDSTYSWVRTSEGNAFPYYLAFLNDYTYVAGEFYETVDFNDEPDMVDEYTPVDNDWFVTQYHDLNKVRIENLVPELDAVDLATGRDAEVESAFINGDNRTVRVETATGSYPISEVVTDLTTSRDWGSVIGLQSSVLGKSVVKNLAAAPGAAATNSLYVRKLTGSDAVYICPGATNLSQVTTTCSGGYELTAASPNVSIVNIGGSDYWKITNVTDVGGLAVVPVTLPEAPYEPPPYYPPSPPVPEINFDIDDYTVNSGDVVTLTWTTTGLTELKLYLNDELYGTLELNGTIDLTIEEETEVRLEGIGPNGTMTRTFIVSLNEPSEDEGGVPKILYFTVTADTSVWPVKVTIEWAVDNVDSVDISGLGDHLAPEGQADVYITEDTTFTLSAVGIGGTAGQVSAQRTIVVPSRTEPSTNTVASAIPLVTGLITTLGVSILSAASTSGLTITTAVNRVGIILGIVRPRKKKTWGFIYDLSTYKPVPFVTIRLLQNGKLIDQTVSQLDGKYGIPVAVNGTYLLEAKALGFETVREEIAVNTLGGTREVVKDLALQRSRKGINIFGYILAYLKPELVKAIRIISAILFVVGLIISIWATTQTPSAINFLLIGFYIIMIGWNAVAFFISVSQGTGSVIDGKTGLGIKGAIVRIISPQEGQVGAYMTNAEGKIKFDLPAGKYDYTVMRNGYEQVVGSEKVQIREDGYLASPITMNATRGVDTTSRELSNPYSA